jgi:asparaginyl-tRNA synthetase
MDRNVVLLKGLIYQSAFEFLIKEGFVVIPYEGVVTATGSCEAVSNVFRLAEDKFLTLTQTVQLQLERDIIQNGLPRMASSNRSYRKDNKNWQSDGRHLNDFELLETEALDTDLNWLIKHCQDMLNYIFVNVLNKSSKYGLLTPEQHKNLYCDYEKGFQRITYTDAVAALKSHNINIEWGEDLSSSLEQKLVQIYNQNLFITHYPEKIKFFNMMLTRKENTGTKDWKENDRQTVECVDCILRHSGESIGGSVREYEYDIIKDRLYEGTMMDQLSESYAKTYYKSKEESINIVKDMFADYLQLFENNPQARSGMGMGLGRVAQFILSSSTIIPF